MANRAKQLLFFFTPEELMTVIQEFESQCVISYHQTGTFNSPVTPVTSSLLGESSLGYLTVGDWNHSPGYLIAEPSTEIIIQNVKLHQGGNSYAVNQRENPDTVFFKPSGVSAKDILVAGSLGTVSTTAYSIKTFRVLANIIMHHTRKIGVFHVGSAAEEELKLGCRLVTNSNSPREYDLKIDG